MLPTNQNILNKHQCLSANDCCQNSYKLTYVCIQKTYADKTGFEEYMLGVYYGKSIKHFGISLDF